MQGRPADDSGLVTCALRGDKAAYEEIVQRYQQVAFRTALIIIGSAADAEDAAQEGFVKAYRALGRLPARRPAAAVAPSHRCQRSAQPDSHARSASAPGTAPDRGLLDDRDELRALSGLGLSPDGRGLFAVRDSGEVAEVTMASGEVVAIFDPAAGRPMALMRVASA